MLWLRTTVAVALFSSTILAASLSACSNASSDSTDNFHPSQTVAAHQGRTAARAMLGLLAGPQTTAPALRDQAAHYEAVAADMLVVIEKQEPGVFDQFGADVSSRDGARFVTAWTAMRVKLSQASASPALLDLAKRDPVLKDATIQSFGAASGLALRDYTPPQDGIPNLGRGADGVFGDGKTGAGQVAADLGGLLADPFTPWKTLQQVDSGALKPDPTSRLGAYQCTGGHAAGTVGQAVHNAIGFIYVALGTYGEEKIGRVFCDPATQALLNDPLNSSSSIRVAQIELRYWDNVRGEDPYSAGGQLGAAFSPSARDFLQQHVFPSVNLGGPTPTATGTSNPPPGTAGADGGTGDGGLMPTDCGDKTDGWWCIDYTSTVGWMAYCQGHNIASGCPCAACLGKGGTPASCSSSPDVCTSN